MTHDFMEVSFYLGAVGTILEYFLMIYIIYCSWKINKQLSKNRITEYKKVKLQLNCEKCFEKTAVTVKDPLK